MRARLLPFALGVALAATGAEAAAGAPPAARPDLAVTFLANNGFLIEAGGKRVLVDALVGDGLRGYPAPAGELRRKLELAQPPFDSVDLVLASHFHRDHFDPAAVAGYLRRVPHARFVSTAQAVGRLRERDDFAALAERLVGFAPAPGKRERLAIAGIDLQLFGLSHGDTENLGIVLELEGHRILHVGDADADAEELRRHELPAETLDVVLVPYWYFLSASGRDAVGREIGARQVIGMHVPAADAPADWFAPATSLEALYERLERDAPGVTLFRTPLERRTFPPAPRAEPPASRP